MSLLAMVCIPDGSNSTFFSWLTPDVRHVDLVCDALVAMLSFYGFSLWLSGR